MKIIRIFIPFFLALLISVLILPLRSISTLISTFVGFFAFYILTLGLEYIYRGKLSRIKLFLSILVGGSIVQIITRSVYYYVDTIGSLPDFIITLLGIVLAYISLYLSRSGKIAIFFVGVGIGIFMYIKGYDLWFNQLDFDTPNGRITKPLNDIDNFKFQNQYGDTLSLADFNSRYVIIDVWHTHCNVCYEKMPKVQTLYEMCKSITEAEVISLHGRWDKEGETVASGTEIVRSKNYSLPCYSINIENALLKYLGIRVYPTVLIVNVKDEKLIFRGNIELAERYLKELI